MPIHPAVLVLAEDLPFWPVQAITCAVIVIVLALLGRYLFLGPRRRGTTGGRDAFVVVRGVIVVAGVAVVAVQGKGIRWGVAALAVASILLGLRAHFQARRR
jgi:hypothetical protein